MSRWVNASPHREDARRCLKYPSVAFYFEDIAWLGVAAASASRGSPLTGRSPSGVRQVAGRHPIERGALWKSAASGRGAPTWRWVMGLGRIG